MDPGARRGATILLGTAGGALLLDQVTKAFAVATLRDGSVDVIPGVLTFRFATNTGGAFSLFSSAPWFFAAASIVVSALIVLFSFRARPPSQALALGLVLGGALGNLADRVFRGPGFGGEVVDFIDLQIWPVFNLADSAIVVGALWLGLASFSGRRGEAAGAPADG